MRKLKLLLTAFALMGGVFSANAQTVPVFKELDDFGGTAVSSLTTFVPNGTIYTLELTECTAGTPITVSGGYFSYTPTTSGTVRFVRFGSNVYVYEGTTYKATKEVSTPEDPTYPTGLTSTSTENLIKNGGFEDTSAGTYTTDRYKPTYWTPYKSDKKDPNDNGVSVRETTSITGSYAMLMHDKGIYLTQQLASDVMKNFTPYQISYKFKANNDSQKGQKYKFQVGSTEFGTDYFNSSECKASTTSIQNFTATFITPATVVNQPYVQIYRSANGSGSQHLDYVDEFILVAATGGGIGITGATGATFLSGSAYAPEGVLAAEVTAERYGNATMRVTNPNFDSDISGWNTPIGNGKLANNKTSETTNFYESWNSTPKEGRMYQVIENLPSGTYELEMIAFADQAGTMTPANTIVSVYAQGQDVGTTSSSYIRPNYVNSVNFTSYKAYAYVDETGKLEIGMRQYSPAEFRWLGMDNVTLKYIATDNQEEEKMLELYQEKWTAVKTACDLLSDGEYTNVKGAERANLTSALSASVSDIGDYATNAAALKTAYLVFKAGKTNWDLLATEIEKATALGASTDDAVAIGNNTEKTATDALQAVKDLKVTEYDYVASAYSYAVSLGSWTTSGPTGSLSAQHWSGESREYLEQSSAAYGQESWDIVYDQNLTLPAGNYVFKVAGRQANSEKVTLSLIVKNGETTLGTVADFPKGDTGLGINKSGATSFNSEDEAGFANSNNGRGWEWRYVKFTLDEDATVNVSVEAHATAKSMWVSFCDATVQTDDEANIALITYNIALNSAIAARDNAAYKYVKGIERSELVAAIDADASLDKTIKTEIETATTTLNTKRETFVNSAPSWNTYTIAKNTTYTDDLPYATDEKFAAIATAQSATAPANATEAVAKTAAINAAVRLYYESHAMAEGVDGAEDETNLIKDPNFAGVTVSGTTAGGWTFDQSGGNAQVTSSESFTDGSDNSSYSYFDYYNGSNNNQNIHQTISNLAPGRYLLTATGRGHTNFNDNLQIYVNGKGSTKIPAIGNSGGVFDRGWNDASVEFYLTETADVTIGAKTNNSQPQWWGVTRFRLVLLGDAVENVTVTDAGFATYVPSYDLNFSSTEIKAYTVKVTEKGVAKLTKVDEVPAGTPVLLHKENGATEDIPMMTGAAAVGENDLVAGTGAEVPTTEGESDEYTNMILNNVSGIGFYFANNQTVATNRAYLHIASEYAPDAVSGSRMVMVFSDETTGISTVKDAGVMVDGYYDLQGRRVTQPSKGLYIVNGKKVVIK